jgi:hypothetical protein
MLLEHVVMAGSRYQCPWRSPFRSHLLSMARLGLPFPCAENFDYVLGKERIAFGEAPEIITYFCEEGYEAQRTCVVDVFRKKPKKV